VATGNVAGRWLRREVRAKAARVLLSQLAYFSARHRWQRDSTPLSPEPIGLRTYCGSGAISSSGANWVPLHALGRQLSVCGPSGSVSLRLYGLVQAFGRVGWGIIFFRIYNANRDRTIIEPLSSVSRGIGERRGVPDCSRITIFAASECKSAVSPYCHIAVSPNCHIAVSPYCHIASPTVPSSYCIAHSVIAISYRHGAATSTFATRRRCHRQSIWRSRGDGLYGAAAPPWVLLMIWCFQRLLKKANLLLMEVPRGETSLR
jgi:hypothetical protein